MALFGRRSKGSATPAVPLPPTHQRTVAGVTVEVHTPAGAVDARFTGHTTHGPFVVRPRQRVGAAVTIPAAAAGFMAVNDERPNEVATGDPAFDARYGVSGFPRALRPTLGDEVRALFLAHDVVFLVVFGGGVWVQVAHAEPAAADTAEAVALRVVELLVSA